ncbi:ArsI/CadI family heavy metal resistance metalloenzyme [Methylocystis hirsuta]|uniref:Glyoxalase/bleomycin resistance/dioxygenase family protein n=1 Tax=Methylocystis hirsuta TaxID=369798 RepID=A0A3M9XSX0_9HYPH|nr:ArsI/CadI family heavy metal resistance metalloenzyme [Methylocystis hirsuta]RNJ51114.1 glyoxalase/bleomycin resistance/dioxygenase family protein [Methylocystis hirsuta]
MKRLHVHVSVDDLAGSIRFYSALFGSEPTVAKPDYAKWMLDDPRVNFAISSRGGQAGVDHLGIEVETAEELKDVYGRLQRAERPVLEEGATTCCYAKSEKAWTSDPQGLLWESFLTSGESTIYGEDEALARFRASGGKGESSPCCGAKPAPETTCCSGAGDSQ